MLVRHGGAQLSSLNPTTAGVAKAMVVTLSTKVTDDRTRFSADSTRFVEQFGTAFHDFIEPLLTEPGQSSKKDKKLQNQMFCFLTKYLCEITLTIDPTQTSTTDSIRDKKSSPNYEEDSLERFQQEYLSRTWVNNAKKAWEVSRWPEIMNKTQIFLTYRLAQKQAKMLEGMFTKYLTFLKTKKWIAKDILLGITVNFLDYIAQHEMDIANASVGCCPSPKIELVNLLAKNSMVGVFGEASFADLYSLILRADLLSKYDLFAEKGMKEISEMSKTLRGMPFVVKGTIVAFPSSSVPEQNGSMFSNPQDIKFICGRVAEPFDSIKTENAKVFIDPSETIVIDVPVKELHLFSGQVDSENFIENPLDSLREIIYPRVKDLCIQLIEKAGVHTEHLEKGKEYQLCDFKALSESNEAASNLRRMMIASENCYSEVIAGLKDTTREWIFETPTAWFPSCFFNETLAELEGFFEGLPSLILNYVEQKRAFIQLKYDSTFSLLHKIISGTKKNEVCGWWLDLIETRVDQYLVSKDFDLDAVPDDYTDQKPPNLVQVKKNLEIIQNIRGEVGGELPGFVGEVTDEVYVVLNRLKEEMEFVLSGGWKGIEGKEEGKLVEDFEKKKESLEKDLEYMEEMSAMDEEIRQNLREGSISPKPLEMTAVIPVSGLVLARFHVHANEHSTALDLWAPSMKGLVDEPLKEEFNFVTFSDEKDVSDLCASMNQNFDNFEETEEEGFLAFIKDGTSQQGGFKADPPPSPFAPPSPISPAPPSPFCSSGRVASWVAPEKPTEEEKQMLRRGQRESFIGLSFEKEKVDQGVEEEERPPEDYCFDSNAFDPFLSEEEKQNKKKYQTTLSRLAGLKQQPKSCIHSFRSRQRTTGDLLACSGETGGSVKKRRKRKPPSVSPPPLIFPPPLQEDPDKPPLSPPIPISSHAPVPAPAPPSSPLLPRSPCSLSEADSPTDSPPAISPNTSPRVSPSSASPPTCSPRSSTSPRPSPSYSSPHARTSPSPLSRPFLSPSSSSISIKRGGGEKEEKEEKVEKGEKGERGTSSPIIFSPQSPQEEEGERNGTPPQKPSRSYKPSPKRIKRKGGGEEEGDEY